MSSSTPSSSSSSSAAAAVIPSHLRLLWDHLIGRTLASETAPARRVQHILDDMDLLLATLSDFISICLVQVKQNILVMGTARI